jgi:hypothetical protein
MMIKKIILLLITLTTLTNVSYASFPIIADTLEATIDTLQTEEIKQYHSNLIKMGIELSSCKCESCRNGIAPWTIKSESNKLLKKNTLQQGGAAGLYILSGLILLGVIIWSFIGLTRAYNCADNGSDCPQSSGEKPKSGAPIGFFLGYILILISVGVAIKARIIQLKNRKINLNNLMIKTTFPFYCIAKFRIRYGWVITKKSPPNW